MNGAGRTIVKNASFLMASQAVSWGLGLVLTIFLTRYLGPSAVGKFHLGVSIWAVLGLFVSFGMDTLLAKEVARSRERTGEILGTTIGLRASFFALSTGVLAFYLTFAGYPEETVIVICIMGATAFFTQLTGACQAVLQGLERMEFISLGAVVNKTVVTLVIIVLLILGHGVFTAAAVGILGALLNLTILLVALRRIDALQLSFRWTRARWLVTSAVPYLMATVFLVLYIQMDVVILSLLIDEATVGWYSAADHLFGTFLFIPGILMQAVFPALSRSHHNAAGSSVQFVRHSFHWLLLLGVPIGLGLVVVSDSLVVLLYGDQFVRSGPVLAVFGVVLIFMYLNTMLGWSLIAMDRQRAWVIVMAIATVATIPLDLVLIPFSQSAYGNGAIGGAIAYIVTEGAMTVIGLRLLPAGTLRRSDFLFSARVVVAGLGMAVLAWAWRDNVIAVPVVTGLVAYPVLLFVFRAIPEEELVMARLVGHGVVQRVRTRILGVQV
jgi:O-antigen/teichoic acid export membrane protein